MNERHASSRAERLKAALRDNLRRRKTQAQGRANSDASAPDEGEPQVSPPSGKR
jgi:hypothetical protein